VRVDYTTADGSAHAGEDYDPASGTLTFAPGEKMKTFDVIVRGDLAEESDETFAVRLRNASGAAIARGEAAAIVQEDDLYADLAVTPVVTSRGTAVNVANRGPRTATNVNVRITSTPYVDRLVCSVCTIPQIAAGAGKLIAESGWTSDQQTYHSAIATSAQRDRQPGDNAATWTVAPQGTLVMIPATLTPGATGTLFVAGNTAPTVSDPSIVTISAGPSGPFTVTALKAGTTTINAGSAQLTVIVSAAGTTPRWPGALSIGNLSASTRFDQPFVLTIAPSGTAPGSGAAPTGTFVVTVAGKEVARQAIDGKPFNLSLYFPRPDNFARIQVSYEGDANFAPQTIDTTIIVTLGIPTIKGELDRTPAPGTYTLTARVEGSPAAPPAGTVTVLNGSTTLAVMTLLPGTNGRSSAQTTLTNLPPAATLTLRYSGDANYVPGTQQVRITEQKRRTGK
jgi:hypothetical protein